MFEQYFLENATSFREVIPELEEAKWGGYTETLRVPFEHRKAFCTWVEEWMPMHLARGEESLLHLLSDLVTTTQERDLLHQRWDRHDRECTKRAKARGREHKPMVRF